MKQDYPSVAIVILNWNGRQFLEKYLPSVIATTYDNCQIIVADNASDDDSVAFLAKHFPTVRIILLPENYGFAGGYNRALQQVQATYFILLNSDVEVTPGWIQPLVKLMESNGAIAACQPKIRSLERREYFEYAGASGGWIDKSGYPFCRGRVFDSCEKDDGQYDDVAEVFWATGAAMCVRSDCFESCGGFDEYLFAHQEEIDLCWRWKNAGLNIFVQPESLVYHLGGGSLAAGSSKKIYLNFRNSLIILYKNHEARGRRIFILKRMVLDGIAGARFLLQGKWKSFAAVIRAHGSFYKWLMRHNSVSSTNKTFTEMAGVYGGSIVKDYFLKGKKFFSEIVENKK